MVRYLISTPFFLMTNILHHQVYIILYHQVHIYLPFLCDCRQKWLHTHRIGVIIEHDEPLGKHLHIPNSSGRFHSVLCRQGLESLNVFLQDWCSFILMENHSYIKLLYKFVSIFAIKNLKDKIIQFELF